VNRQSDAILRKRKSTANDGFFDPIIAAVRFTGRSNLQVDVESRISGIRLLAEMADVSNLSG
jgi:hypothetical protein